MDNDNRKELRDIGSDGSGGQSEGLEGPTNSGDVQYIVRRLTPTECAALQGFPKDWCADVPHSDSAEYKLWGNGIALPSILGIVQNAVMKVERLKNG